MLLPLPTYTECIAYMAFRVEPEVRAHWGEKELKMDEDTQT